MNLREFYEKRHKVLILRSVGGLGDILMHRMMFEDFKLLMPEVELYFACPSVYHDAVIDDPFLTSVITPDEVERENYITSYNTTSACGRHEMKRAPFSGEHRSDIWSNHCGVSLTKHEMNFRLTDEEKAEGRRIIESHRDRQGPSVVVAPISAMENKNLLDYQLVGLMRQLQDRGLYPFGLHTIPIYDLLKNDIPTIGEIKLKQWMGVIDQADYVISVDSAAFHCAGGMKKPLVGIYTFADGKVYGKYFDCFIVQKHRDYTSGWDCGPCYNWGNCPKTKKNPKPCLTEITVDDIMEKVDLMLKKWPR
jgi:ADP-heptose:LPS heptosyltransferase